MKNIKSKIVNYVMMGIILGCSSCKSPDSIYQEFIVPNGLEYPGKAINIEAFPGKNRIIISWQISDPKVVKTQIFWNNNTKSEEVIIEAEMEDVGIELTDMPENTYSFMIRTFDADKNASIPVEVTSKVYGAMYERSLVCRSIRKTVHNENDGLTIDWSGANLEELFSDLTYTDVKNKSHTISIDKSETATNILDLDFDKPVYYQSIYQPDIRAIDIFKSSVCIVNLNPDIYPLDMTDIVLKNPRNPFRRGAALPAGNYVLPDWIINAAGAENGNVRDDGSAYFARGWTLPRAEIINGKMYQTVELEAGKYRFRGYCNGMHTASTINTTYLVVALGNDLPDSENLGLQSLGYKNFPTAWANMDSVIEFDLYEKSTVSMGFLTTLTSANENCIVFIDGVELWRLE